MLPNTASAPHLQFPYANLSLSFAYTSEYLEARRESSFVNQSGRNVAAQYCQRRSFHSTKISVEPHHSYPSHPVMAQEQIKNTRQRPLSGPVIPSQHRPFVGPTPNMLPSNLPVRSERNATGGQAFLPPVAPPHWPSFPHLNYPFENPYPDLTVRRRQHPLPFSMSRNEHNVDPNTGARSIDLKQPATPMQGSGHASSADQRHDSLTKGDNAHVSPAPLPTGWNGSRIPSNNVPRKAPLAARSSDDISPFIARNIPPTNQQRSTSQSKATSGPSKGNRVRQQKSFNTPPLGTPKRGRPRLDDGVQDNNKAGGLNSQGDTHIGQKASAQPPIGLFAPPQVSSAIPPKPVRPCPRYDYVVPLELVATQKALGNCSSLKALGNNR